MIIPYSAGRPEPDRFWEHGDPDRPGSYPHKGGGKGEYTIKRGGWGEDAERPILASGNFTEDEYQRGLKAPLILRPGGDASARLGTPGRWVAPNGVTVAYARNNADEAPVSFHQMENYNEMAVPLTEDLKLARAALEAWAEAHLQSSVTTRWQARQLVRPGD